MAMNKHVTNEHGLDLVKYTMHKISLEGKDSIKRQKCKNKTFVTPIAIINFFGGMRPYKKSNPIQMGFIEDFFWMIVRGYMPLSIVESPWLRQMGLLLCGQVQFPFCKQLVHEHLPVLLQKTMEVYVFLDIG